MTLTEKLDSIIAQCREALALADKATPGPWFFHDGMVQATLPPLLEPHTRPCNVAKCYTESIFRDKNISIDEMHGNTRLIATSRTLTPRLARATITIIPALKLVYDSHVDAQWYNAGVSGLAQGPCQCSICGLLQRIADEWEEKP